MLQKFLFCVVVFALIATIASAQTAAPANATKDSAQAPAAAPTPAPAPKVEPANKGGALYFSKEKVDEIFAAGGSFIKDKDKNYVISAGKRSTPGQAEIHGKDTDIFFVIDGTATIVTGGALVDEKTTGPDEFRGASINGGSPTQLKKGELIVIPHGTPHWISQVEGTFQYLVVKVR